MLRSLRQAVEDFRQALRTTDPTPKTAPIDAVPPAPATELPPTELVALPPGTEPGAGPADAEPSAAETEVARMPAATNRPSVLLSAFIVAGLVVVGMLILRRGPWLEVEPADPTVVATHRGGVVTRDELRKKLEALPREEQARYRTVAGLRLLVTDLAVERTVSRWAQERQLDQREQVKDAIKHATEEVHIADIAEQIHEGRIPVGAAEIQVYYDSNRERFGERPLVEVRDQIRRLVVEEKEATFVQEYLTELRERASLQVDYALLEVREPSEAELRAYYQTNRERFRVPDEVRIAQIQVSVSLTGGDDQARAKAESARARAAAGEDFGQLARELSDGAERAQGGELARLVVRGSRGPAFDEAVGPLQVGGISPALKEGDSYYVVHLRDRQAERVRPYEEVRGEIADTLRADFEAQAYRERENRTLFSIRGRRTTLGEFLQELDELPADVRARYPGTEGKRTILGNLIERLLVVEDATEQAVDVKRKDEIEHARINMLARFLHEEEIDRKVQVSDEEARAAYQRNPGRHAEPPQVKVRYIRVARGTTSDADVKARAKIEEAAAQLRPAWFFGRPEADFAELARQYSDDPETAAQGGALDRWIAESGDPTAELFEHALHEELFPLKVGEVSHVLPLGDSYYLFQIMEKQEGRQRPFEEAREAVRRELEARKHDELARAMQRQLLDRMQLRVYDGRLESVLAELGGPALVGGSR